jgi:hypothetical protein
MRTSLETLEVESPLDHSLEAVLPGVHTRLSSLQSEMASGFSQVKQWQQSVDSFIQENTSIVRQSQAAAGQLVRIASSMLGWSSRGVGAGGGAWQGSPAPLLNSQQQAAAAANDNDDDDEDDDLRKAKRHQMIKRHQSLYTIYYEWYGLESSKDQPIVGGFEKCEELFKSSWRKPHTDAEKKHFSRLKKIIQGLKEKAAREELDMEEVVEILESTFAKDCKKALSKMVDWMMTQGLIPEGKKRATSA